MERSNNWYHRKHQGYEIARDEEVVRQVRSGEGMPALHQSRTEFPEIKPHREYR